MPSLAALHPQVVHFVVALILVGVVLRWASLAWRAAWLTPAATDAGRPGHRRQPGGRAFRQRRARPGRARAGRAAGGGGPRDLGRAGPQRLPAAAGGRGRRRGAGQPAAPAGPQRRDRRRRRRPGGRRSCSTAPPISAVSWSTATAAASASGPAIPQDVSRVFIAGAHHQAAQDRAVRPPARCGGAGRPAWPRGSPMTRGAARPGRGHAGGSRRPSDRRSIASAP